MTILLAPDKFKGSLSAKAVCAAITQGIHQWNKDIEVVSCPMADGGDGSLQVLEQYLTLEEVKLEVLDPLFRPIQASYKRSADTAYIEMATASGLVLLADEERNCMNATSFGTGQLITDALQKGIKNIVLFVGGSATNDGGIGMATALGYTFLNEKNEKLLPVGKSLTAIHKIDDKNLAFDPSTINVKVVCDVKNPLTGANGAAHTYAAQKGASESEILELDKGLSNLAHRLVQQAYPDINTIEGSGAAGGIGGGAVAFLGAEICSGIDFFIQKTDFKTKLNSCQLLITGEGKIDEQTLQGKVVSGVSQLAKERSIPTIAFCGYSALDSYSVLHLQEIYSILDVSTSVEDAMESAAEKLSLLAFEAMSIANIE